MLFSYLHPAVDFVTTYRSAEAAKSELLALQAENRSLERRAKAALEPGVLEREARRQGMVAPGERPYVVKGLR